VQSMIILQIDSYTKLKDIQDKSLDPRINNVPCLCSQKSGKGDHIEESS